MLKQISEFWVVVMFLCSASRIFEPLRTWIRTFDICVLGVVKILSGGYVFDIVRVTNTQNMVEMLTSDFHL